METEEGKSRGYILVNALGSEVEQCHEQFLDWYVRNK